MDVDFSDNIFNFQAFIKSGYYENGFVHRLVE